eukprot:m.119828 g.119828  ORF g.119828 m.119828 type:complete len:134 (+) comp9263_c0_seq1:2037-2438(+)
MALRSSGTSSLSRRRKTSMSPTAPRCFCRQSPLMALSLVCNAVDSAQHCLPADRTQSHTVALIAAAVYEEMRKNILASIFAAAHRLKFYRIHAMMPPGPVSFNKLIGRAAHIAMLDDETFVPQCARLLAAYFA